MSRENLTLVISLVLGVWIIVLIHGTAYLHGKRRLEAVRGTGTLTDKTVTELRSRNLKRGSVELAVWVTGVIVAKVVLVASRRARRSPPGRGPGAGEISGDGSPSG